MNITVESVLQNGKYRIDAVLGQGEFGVTYRAIYTPLHQKVVIKTLHPKFIASIDFPQIKQQFLTVAQQLSKCRHPNLVQVLDGFEEQNLPFVVMNYIPGKTLAEFLESSPPLSVHQAIQYIRQISSALRTLHYQGLLHCNLQPHNILLRADTNTVTLVDFGLASGFVHPSHHNLIRNRALSIGYASLEHYLPHQRLTPATDIYSLAALFYRLLTGEPPLEAPLRVNEATQQLLSASKPSLRQIQPTLSPVVERLISWGLELEPQRRPQSIDQWIAFLPIDETPTVIQSPNTVVQRQNTVAYPPTTLQPVEDKLVGQSGVAVLEPPPAPPQPNPPEIIPLTIDQLEPIRNTLSLGFLLPILFVITSLFFGWVGFDLTRRYGYIVSQKANLYRHNPFSNLDPTKPIFNNPSVETQLPGEVAAERSTEEPLEVGDFPGAENVDSELPEEETLPIDEESNVNVVTENVSETEAPPQSPLEEYLLESEQEDDYSATVSQPDVTDPSALETTPNYSDYNIPPQPYDLPQPAYSPDPTVTTDIEGYSEVFPAAGGGGSYSEEYYTDPTIPLDPNYSLPSEETTPTTPTSNYDVESDIPTSSLIPPLTN